jgi:hypothetical protein
VALGALLAAPSRSPQLGERASKGRPPTDLAAIAAERSIRLDQILDRQPGSSREIDQLAGDIHQPGSHGSERHGEIEAGVGVRGDSKLHTGGPLAPFAPHLDEDPVGLPGRCVGPLGDHGGSDREAPVTIGLGHLRFTLGIPDQPRRHTGAGHRSASLCDGHAPADGAQFVSDHHWPP